MERAMSLPFSVDESGSILSSADPRRIWQSRVIAAVMTQIGERVFRPQFGGVINQALFETPEAGEAILRDSIQSVFSSYLKALALTNIEVVMDFQSSTLNSTIYYTLPSGEKTQVALKTGTLTRSGDTTQEY